MMADWQRSMAQYRKDKAAYDIADNKCGGWSDLVRKTFKHERLAYNRRSNRSAAMP